MGSSSSVSVSCSANHSSILQTVETWITSVTDRRTDRLTRENCDSNSDV